MPRSVPRSLPVYQVTPVWFQMWNAFGPCRSPSSKTDTRLQVWAFFPLHPALILPDSEKHSSGSLTSLAKHWKRWCMLKATFCLPLDTLLSLSLWPMPIHWWLWTMYLFCYILSYSLSLLRLTWYIRLLVMKDSWPQEVIYLTQKEYSSHKQPILLSVCRGRNCLIDVVL